MSINYDNFDLAVKQIVDHVGKKIVLGVPLGLGKPIGFLNALYRLASNDSSISLTIVTGLTLARPNFTTELEERFVAPILDRILVDYEDPLYEKARSLQQLPANIRVVEFFFVPGKFLHNAYVQQNYVSSKYSSAARDSFTFEINVLAQQVVRSADNRNLFSLSCNTDLFNDVFDLLQTKQKTGINCAVVAEINMNLPFMSGDAAVFSNLFTAIIDTGSYKHLFAVPQPEISPQDHLIGLYTSCLIKDNSCLQIGIGNLANAIANALILRHKQNKLYRDLLTELQIEKKFSTIINTVGELTPFEKGLYASTEMFSDEYMQLYQQGILKKRVYDHIGLQKLLNAQEITEEITADLFEKLISHHIISSPPTTADIKFMQDVGLIKMDAENSANYTQRIGEKLLGGKILHAGFFLGSNDFYQQLRELSHAEKSLFDMTSVARTNSLFWNPELLQLQRRNARFVNTCMMITLGGAVVSDGVKNLQEVSGVGGQFDFVNMAQDLESARSIMNCRSTRVSKEGTQSNILWDYPNITIPRYLRDIFITEYGIADCRSKVDAEIIQALLTITDSRFQHGLTNKAKINGKLKQHYEIPALYAENDACRYKSVVTEFKLRGYFQPYPFGTELTEVEQKLTPALLFLKNASQRQRFKYIFLALFNRIPAAQKKYLARLNLDKPKNIREYIYAKLLAYILHSLSTGSL